VVKINYDKDKIIEIIDKVVRKTMTMDMPWDWPCGVAFYGICRAYEETGNREYLDMLINWTDEYITLGLPEWTINTCAMGHMLITLYEETDEQKYWDIVMSKVDYLRNRASRFGENVLAHLHFPEQAWADTLFMAAFFLLRVGVKLQDQELIQDALNQFYWHIRYLQDPVSGFWYHGYDNINKRPYVGDILGQGQCLGCLHDVPGTTPCQRLVPVSAMHRNTMLTEGPAGCAEICTDRKGVMADNTGR